MKEKMKVIGIGDDGKQSLLPIYEKWIYESDVLVGGERQLAFFQDFHGEKIMIKGGLSSLVDNLENEERKVVILASGDPLFFGIGSYLARKLNVDVYPYLSSLQQAFTKMNESWHDAYIVSIHGRSMKGLAQRINGREKVALLTDTTNSPSQLAHYLLSFGMSEYKAFVAENLGGESERYAWYDLEEMENREFSPLNIVILKKTSDVRTWSFGIDDEEFHQRKPEKGLLTKKQVRILSLSEMKLTQKSIVWDIGTCTGSVAIEACLLAKEGQIFAIEKNDYDLENCRLNMQKFRTDFTVVQGKAPDKLDEFPNPDAIFIGGTAGGMEEILSVCCSRLNKGGRIVLNAVTIENLSQAIDTFKRNGLEVHTTLAQISRSKPILNLTRFDALNPIYIITARHKKGDK